MDSAPRGLSPELALVREWFPSRAARRASSWVAWAGPPVPAVSRPREFRPRRRRVASSPRRARAPDEPHPEPLPVEPRPAFARGLDGSSFNQRTRYRDGGRA
jgi:hypothetical protein